MMRFLKITLTTLVICLISIPLLSCASESDSTTESEVYTVQRGDLSTEITAVGNLSYSVTEELAFEVSGTVAEVLVEEGDTVGEEQVLVTLDTSEWDEQLRVLKKGLVTAERNLTEAERQIAAKELAVHKAQVELQVAEYDLYQIGEVKEAKEAVDEAKYNLEIAKAVLKTTSFSTDWWEERVIEYKAMLEIAEEELEEILSGTSVKLSDDIALDIAKAQLQVEQCQRQLEDAQIALDDVLTDIEDAEEAVSEAQEALDEFESSSPVITAPFDGFIIKVNVEGGDEVLKGTVAVQIADPDKFEADILVSEMDIFQVEIGGTAWVEVDALSGVSWSANVTHISPTATIQSGVVNYTVRVELQSFEAMQQERQEAAQEIRQEIASGEMPERLKQAIEEGRITQEQAEEMMERMQSGEMPSPPEGFEGETSFPSGSEGERPFSTGGTQVPTISTENLQLREGLTVTVSIITDERTDVVLVPNSAITYQGDQAYVQVMSPDGIIEERAIRTGITDYQYTEVTEGLSEGEEVVVPQGTATTSTTQEEQGPGMRFFMPR